MLEQGKLILDMMKSDVQSLLVLVGDVGNLTLGPTMPSAEAAAANGSSPFSKVVDSLYET
eukprot:CAMPEP_0170510076 /NCGR_PEP_ID=MMETSP0208-20121228/65567_1 /TAXON_ID=197538 /ORGANISM="Strombidium inclinatum, Strain S3" /LENGTH=59 /DNA_ID=CAMNT_0010793499 /DNA_START=1723 /DNA_END=1902 /DNA_ORIENTATION=-